mgnify:CR=1 FL=1
MIFIIYVELGLYPKAICNTALILGVVIQLFCCFSKNDLYNLSDVVSWARVNRKILFPVSLTSINIAYIFTDEYIRNNYKQ